MGANELTKPELPPEAEQAHTSLQLGVGRIVRVVMCGSIEGLSMEEVDQGKRACNQGYLQTADHQIEYDPNGLPPDVAERLQADDSILLEYGRCREHGRVAVYNAIPPRERSRL